MANTNAPEGKKEKEKVEEKTELPAIAKDAEESEGKESKVKKEDEQKEEVKGETEEDGKKSEVEKKEEKNSQEVVDNYEPRTITGDLIKEIQRELGLIRLCWPEVDLRENAYLSALPDKYSEVGDKERLVIWYAENFRRQLQAKNKYRKPILFVCENECGVQRFVSTNIRRSTLPYPELYTWQGCAKFVADYVEYEQPDNDLILPKRLRSPMWTKNFHTSNNIESATFLTSLLLGHGYNAYVVLGYASREQIQCNRTRTTCPYIPAPKPPPLEEEGITDLRYKFKPPPDLRSQHLLAMEERERKKLQAEVQRREEEEQRRIQELEKPPPDKNWGHRIHSWVLVLPAEQGVRKLEDREPFFIEPPTGVTYKLDDPQTHLLYLGVESIWNDLNYWVNMQEVNNCGEINWDLTKTELWEHLLPGEPFSMRGVDDSMVEDEVIAAREQHLDMPYSYCDIIEINSLEFERRYPNGHKTIYYKKARVDLYAPYMQTDGLVEQVTIYQDYDYTIPIQIHEKYENRSDYLVRTWKQLNSDRVIDYYKRGRADACKEHHYPLSNQDASDNTRTIFFYDVVRLDGLHQIQVQPFRLTQHFVGRDDRLYYRDIEFSTDKTDRKDISQSNILRIIEKYHRNEAIEASRDIAVQEFAIAENKYRIKFHYEKGRSTRATRTIVKPEPGETINFEKFVQKYNPNPLAPPEKNLFLYYEYANLVKREDSCLVLVKDAEGEISSFLKTRANEYINPNLNISIFDRNRARDKDLGRATRMDTSLALSLLELTKETNHLGPYLARIGNPIQLSRALAYLLREDCLSDFKQLQVDKANIILSKFKELKEELDKIQAVMLTQAEELTREEEEQILEKTEELNYNMHVLEVKLNRHRELVPVRYRALLESLQNNVHLDILYRQ